MKANRCIILEKHGTYETYHSFARLLAQGIRELSIPITEIEFNNLPVDSPYNEEALQTFLTALPESSFVLSLNGFGNNLKTVEGQSLYDFYGVTFVSVLVDDPMWVREQALTRFEKQIFTCIDETHLDILREAYGHSTGFFVPHGGTEASSFRELSFKERSIDVLFAGTYISAQSLLEDSPFLTSPKSNAIFHHIVEKLLGSETTSYYGALRAVVAEDLGLQLQGDKLRQYLEVFRSAMQYARFLRRDQLLLKLVQDGIRIECYGSGWDTSSLCSYSNFYPYKPISYNEILERMNRSKMVLNCSPMWTHGSHERVFSAMCNGSVALTNNSVFFNKILKDNENAIFYSFKDLDALPDKICQMLRKPSLLEAISQNGRKLAQTSFTWHNAAENIHNILFPADAAATAHAAAAGTASSSKTS